ncbi:MAG: TonB-dependent receptor, partial [Myxococcales bacterium]|nr:TonB-dependent receptor [Myxococcales bacterium]
RLLSRSRDDFKALGQQFARTWDVSTQTAPPPLSVSLAAGRPFTLLGRKMGVLSALAYRQSWLNQTVERTSARVRGEGADRVVEADDTQRIERLERTINLSGLLELDAELAPGHRVWSTTLLLRSTDDITRQRTGFDGDQMTDIRVNRLEWVERMLLDQILRGQHATPLGRVDWAYALSLATRDEPDRRSTRYDYEPPSQASGDPGGYRMYDRPEGNQRFYSAMDDVGHDARVGWTVPLTDARRADAPDEPTQALKLGARFTRRERESTTYRFRFLDRLGELGVDPATRRAVLGANPNTTLGEESLRNGWFELRDNTQPTDSYTGRETVAAAYAMGEAELPWNLRAMAGLRVEYGEVAVITQRPFAANAEALESAPDSTELLPAATLTWALSDTMQLRGGYTQTLIRPDFHELSPAQKDPVDGDRPVKGNPDLKSGLIRHLDLRWEWYPSPRESLSVAGFFKAFEDPIEATINAGADGTLSFRNSAGASNLGLEIEARKQLGFLGNWGEDLFVAGNLALIRSEVDLSGDSVVTSKSRPLEGQSPYVLNLQLGWE